MKERVVVITGASRGLGAGMAEAMHGRGFRLGLCARTMPTIGPEPGRVVAQRLDMRDPEAVRRFGEAVVRELGPIDLWINNAGVLEPIAFVRDVDPAAFLDHLAINLGGVLHGSQAFVRLLRASARSGVLINVTSGAAQKPYEGWAAYCSSKAAVDMFTQVLDAEEDLLRAHAVAPGLVDTDMQRTLRSLGPEQFPAVDKFRAIKAQERFNSPAFVAAWMIALAFSPRGDEPVVLRVPEEHP